MGVAKVNVVDVDLETRLDEFGFRHAATAVGGRLGARRIGASVYEAEPGAPIWPYHFHHGVEEWLYVIAGVPVLREAAGERTLAPGDLVCFPSGPLGAHTVQGLGRFVIFSTGQHIEPWMSVYPDSGKVSGPEGMRLLGTAVGYWHGEGTAGPQPREDVARAAENVPARPVVNLSAGAIGGLGPALGADRLGGTVVELAPDEEPEPYHYVHGREDWLLVLTGTPALRHPSGEEQLRAGDLLCLPEGLAGARQLLSRGDSVARALLLSTTGLPVNAHYPDTGHWMIRNGTGPEDTALLMSRTPDRLRSPHDGRDRRGPRDQETGT